PLKRGRDSFRRGDPLRRCNGRFAGGDVSMARRFLTSTWAVVGLAWLGALSLAPAQEALRSQPVRLHVLLPQDDAQLPIGGRPTQQTGKSRWVESPPPAPGQTFVYTLTAVREP